MNSFLPFLMQQQPQRSGAFLPAMPQYGGQTGQAGFGPGQGTAGGTTQSLGDMARDTFALGRGFGAPSLGSIGGGLLGSAIGLGPIGGVLGSWAQNAYNTTMGAREGNAARAGIGSGVPSQKGLGAFLDMYGPMTPGEMGASGLPQDGSFDQRAFGGYNTENNQLGWGLADRAAADMAAGGFGGGGGISGSGGQSAGPGGKGDSTGGGAKGEGGGGWYAKGGVVHGQGFLPGNPPGPDNQIAAVQTGEGILTRAAMKHYPGLLAAANAGRLPKKATKVR